MKIEKKSSAYERFVTEEYYFSNKIYKMKKFHFNLLFISKLKKFSFFFKIYSVTCNRYDFILSSHEVIKLGFYGFQFYKYVLELGVMDLLTS